MSKNKTIQSKCAICGKISEQNVLLSVSSLGYMDLDTRPASPMREYLSNSIQECPCCHYCNSDISIKDTNVSQITLQLPAYSKLVSNNNIDSLTKKFLLSATINRALTKNKDAGYMYLYAAWRFDDLNNIDNAKKARLKAIDCFKKYLNHSNDHHCAVIVVDLLRRCEEFDEAIDTANFILALTEDQLLRQVLNLEIELSQKKDSSVHNVGEVAK
ncbi:MAG: DUF2225 domain-containing protein [Alphaproteobacteria bacterium]|nr:DUF2225 domain-containing protein [Alphaproteobacteria bacterium]